MRIRSNQLARAAALVCLGLFFAGAARAADRIKLADGGVVDGDPIAYDEGTKVLTFRLTTGKEARFTIDQLDQRSVYQVTQSKIAKDNLEGQLKLGNYARDIGLYAHSARHYRYALAAHPEAKERIEAQIATLKVKAAAWGMDNARKSIERGDLRDAEKWLEKVIEKLPDMPEAQEAQGLLERYYTRTMAAPAAVAAAAPTNLLETDLKKGKKNYDDMVAKTKAGLTQDRAGSKAVKQWEAAIKDGERALGELDKVAKKYTDPATTELLAYYRKVVNEQIIETRLHLASHQMTRTSFNAAMSQVNQSLALDSKNPDALAMRSRIENAAGNGWGWW